MIRATLLTLVAAALFAAPRPDWPAARQEALDTLVDLVKLDTSQPEGNEIRAAKYLKAKLDAEGIASAIVEAKPGRASLIARVKGNGSKRPLLLLGHLDVVAVERSEWSFDPFGGVVEDGILYARGSGDDKGVVAGSFQTLLMLHRLQVPLARDVIFLGVADEEAGGLEGITYLLDNHRDGKKSKPSSPSTKPARAFSTAAPTTRDSKSRPPRKLRGGSISKPPERPGTARFR